MSETPSVDPAVRRDPAHRAPRPPLSSLPRRRAAPPALLLALFAALVISSTARSASAAAPSALVVFGRAEARIQDIVYSVVDRVLRQAGWPLVPALAANEATIVRGCLGKEAPWPCVESMATKKGIERIVAVRVDLERSADGTSQVVLTGRLVYAGSSSVLEQKRYCGACSDEDLTAYSEEISKLLLDERAVQAGTTKVGVTSVPMGAEVRIDGKVVGITNNVFGTYPGKHTVEVRAPGHEPETRAVTAIDGKTVTASVTLRTKGSPPVAGGSEGVVVTDDDDGEGGSPLPPWAPKAIIGVGGILAVTGVVLLVMDEEPVATKGPDVPEFYFESQNAGIATLVSGVAVAGVGGYLWWKYSSKSTAPVVTTSSNRVLVGISGVF
jgi:PEGA domain